MAGMEEVAEEQREISEVFVEALEIYAERNAKYKSGWKKAGWRTHLNMMKHKVGRLLNSYEGGEDGLDDAIDLLNFTVFFVLQAREGREHDTTEW